VVAETSGMKMAVKRERGIGLVLKNFRSKQRESSGQRV